jgi:hypothetical protein
LAMSTASGAPQWTSNLISSQAMYTVHCRPSVTPSNGVVTVHNGTQLWQFYSDPISDGAACTYWPTVPLISGWSLAATQQVLVGGATGGRLIACPACSSGHPCGDSCVSEMFFFR